MWVIVSRLVNVFFMDFSRGCLFVVSVLLRLKVIREIILLIVFG